MATPRRPRPQLRRHRALPLLNFTSLVAFLTWFGAAGYAALQFAGWPLAGALAGRPSWPAWPGPS